MLKMGFSCNLNLQYYGPVSLCQVLETLCRKYMFCDASQLYNSLILEYAMHQAMFCNKNKIVRARVRAKGKCKGLINLFAG